MDLKKIPIGKNPPTDINVVVEIPLRGDPVKYEICKESGAMFVDRFLHTAMYYPTNYGFVPHTLSDDGDPVDVMVVGKHGVAVGSVLRSRPIGVLLMEDESGQDEKILAVPHAKLHPFYDEVQSYKDLPDVLIKQIEHFFAHYKDLEEGKWVKVIGWGDAEKAGEIIKDAIKRAEKKKK
ncbi:inorganic diphosphatase [Magnetospirillum moscoviense]|uniref:Inorganic pyrophosphatase n=1 Tax=Magnetospirillum moscoviense TaxID=1437059 RepID=A0A178MPD1_9PROT|nr:inorganic diphosphatase [Magnetospirillum moscoviense]MBF0326301.1 inorganic diphosphatase [Alphaproteobacteria bacterium]OAN50403.1 inorganic pyrophosphatase [Magnetospirillum moscoviense]